MRKMTPSPADVAVLLATRLAGRGSADRIEAVARHLCDPGDLGDPGDIAARLVSAVEEGHVRVRGQERRHSLTPAGDAELSRLLADQADAAGLSDLRAAYEEFLPLNQRFLALLSSAPAMEKPAALAGLVEELAPVLATLEELLPRFGGYRGRFESALRNARQDPAWIESPRVDSIHTVWFELHEHLLATLGRDRTDER